MSKDKITLKLTREEAEGLLDDLWFAKYEHEEFARVFRNAGTPDLLKFAEDHSKAAEQCEVLRSRLYGMVWSGSGMRREG